METKICIKCNLELNRDDNFYKTSVNKSGYMGVCKSCYSDRTKIRRARNRKVLQVVDLDGELWTPIQDYPLYYVSNKGRIKSDFHSVPDKNGILSRSVKAILKPNSNNTGYYSVSIRNENGVKNTTIHRLVAKAFIPNYENKREVNHKDGDKLNNNVENLEWTTPSENSLHAFRNGLSKPTYHITNPFGISKVLSDSDIPEIRELSKTTSFRKIAKKYSVCPSTIRYIVHKKTWKHIL